jgi:hypothetical protein
LDTSGRSVEMSIMNLTDLIAERGYLE